MLEEVVLEEEEVLVPPVVLLEVPEEGVAVDSVAVSA